MIDEEKTIYDQMKEAYLELGEALVSERRVDIPIDKLTALLTVARETGRE